MISPPILDEVTGEAESEGGISMPKLIQAYVDGGCYKNGQVGAEAYGSYKIYDVSSSGVLTHVEMVHATPILENMRFSVLPTKDSGRVTNNVAEAVSMQMLINELVRCKFVTHAGSITVFSDSELIINQLKGLYSTKHQQLLDIHQNTYKTIVKWEREHGRPFFDIVELKKVSGDLMKQILGH